MTIPLTGAGSLNVKLGHIAQAINDVNAFRGGPITKDGITTDIAAPGVMTTRVLTTLEDDYEAGTPMPQVIDPLVIALPSWQGAQSAWLQSLQLLAQNTLAVMANDDTPQLFVTYQSGVNLLYQQMVANGDYLS